MLGVAARCTATASLVVLAATGMTGCGTSHQITAGTSCSDYLKQSADKRHVAASVIAAQYGKTGNPLWGLSVDDACATEPSLTVGDYFSQNQAPTGSPPGETGTVGPAPTIPETTTTIDPVVALTRAAAPQLLALLAAQKPCFREEAPEACSLTNWIPFAAAARHLVDQLRTAGMKLDPYDTGTPPNDRLGNFVWLTNHYMPGGEQDSACRPGMWIALCNGPDTLRTAAAELWNQMSDGKDLPEPLTYLGYPSD